MLDLGTAALRRHEMRVSLRYPLQYAAMGEQGVS